MLVVIPARGGSKTVPRKNLADLGGRPLMAWSIRAALEARGIDRVIVSTEDAEIAEVAREWGAEVPFVRPDELAGDEVSLIPVLQHAERVCASFGWDTSVVASLQPTSPFIRASTIEKAMAVQFDTGCDSVTSVAPVLHNHPYRVFRINADARMDPLIAEGERFLQKQDLEAFHAISGGLYVRRREVLAGWSGRDFCLGQDRRAVALCDSEALDIDTPLDLAICRALLNSGHARAHGETDVDTAG